MNHRTYKTNRLAPIDLFADLKVACDAGTLEIKANGSNVFVRLPSFRSAYTILTMLGAGTVPQTF